MLIVLLAATGFLAILDNVVSISSIPFLRNPAALAAAILVVLYVWYRRAGWPLHHGVQRWMLAFLMYTATLEVLRGVWTGDLDILRYASWGQVLVLALIAIDLARDRRAFVLVWGGIVAGIAGMAALSVLPFTGFAQEAAGRTGFAGVNLNRQAYWYALALVTCLWWALARWPRFGWRGVALVGMSAVLTVALVQTGSRGALLSLVVGSIIVLALSLRSRNLSAYATVIPIALVLGAWYVADGTIVSERLAATLSGEDYGTRDSIALHAIDLIVRQPWFGYGPGFASELGDARGMTRGISSHNSFLQVIMAFGIPGFLIWGGIMLSTLSRTWRSWLTLRRPVGALLVALFTMSIAYGLVADLAFNKHFWLLVALGAQAPLAGRDEWSDVPAEPRTLPRLRPKAQVSELSPLSTHPGPRGSL